MGWKVRISIFLSFCLIQSQSASHSGPPRRAIAFEVSIWRHFKLSFVGDDVPDWADRGLFVSISVHLCPFLGTDRQLHLLWLESNQQPMCAADTRTYFDRQEVIE